MSASVVDPVQDPVLGIHPDPIIDSEVPDLALPVHEQADDVSNPSIGIPYEILPKGVVPLVKADASSGDVSNEMVHHPELEDTTAFEEPANGQDESGPLPEDVITVDNKDKVVDQVEIMLHKIEDAHDIPALDVDSTPSDPFTDHDVVDTAPHGKGDDTTDIHTTEAVIVSKHGEPASDESVIPVVGTAEEDVIDKSINDSAIEIPPPPAVEKKEDDAGEDVAPTDKPNMEPVEAEAKNHVEGVKTDDTNTSIVGGEEAPEVTNYAQNGDAPVTAEAAHIVQELKGNDAAAADETSENNEDGGFLPPVVPEEPSPGSTEEGGASRTDVIEHEAVANASAANDPVVVEPEVAAFETVAEIEEDQSNDNPQEVVIESSSIDEALIIPEEGQLQEADTEVYTAGEAAVEDVKGEETPAEPIPSAKGTEPTENLGVVEDEQAEEAFVKEDGVVHEAESPATEVAHSSKVNGHEALGQSVKEESADIVGTEELTLAVNAAEEEPTIGGIPETHEDTPVDIPAPRDANELVEPCAVAETTTTSTTEAVMAKGVSVDVADQQFDAPSATTVVQGAESGHEDITASAEAETVRDDDGVVTEGTTVTSEKPSAPVEVEPIATEEAPAPVLEADTGPDLVQDGVAQPVPEAVADRDLASDDSQATVEPATGDAATESQNKGAEQQHIECSLEPITAETAATQDIQEDLTQTAASANDTEGGITSPLPKTAVVEAVGVVSEVADEAPAQEKEELPEADIKDDSEVVLGIPSVALATSALEETLSGVVSEAEVNAKAGEETLKEAANTGYTPAENGQLGGVSESREEVTPVVDAIDEGTIAEDVVQPVADVLGPSSIQGDISAAAELEQQAAIPTGEATREEHKDTTIHVLNTEMLSIETSLDTTPFTPVLDSGIELKEQESRPSQLLSIAEEIERPKSPWAPSFHVTTVGGDVPQGDEIAIGAGADDVAPVLESVEVTSGTDGLDNSPAFKIEHVAGSKEDLASVDEQSLEPGKLWTHSYSVHSQGSPIQEKIELVEDVSVTDQKVAPEINPEQVESGSIVTEPELVEKVSAEGVVSEAAPSNVVEGETEEVTNVPVVTAADKDAGAVQVPGEQAEATPDAKEVADPVITAAAEQPKEHTAAGHSKGAEIVATTTPVIAVHDHQDHQTNVPPSSQADVSASDATEPPAGSWTPSYSIHSQSNLVVQSVELHEAEPEDVSISAESAALGASAERWGGTAEAKAVEVVIPSESVETITLQPQEEPWTPSYSVHSQGSILKEVDDLSAGVEASGESIAAGSADTSLTEVASSISFTTNIQGTILKEVGISSPDAENHEILLDETGSSVVQPLEQGDEVEKVVAATVAPIIAVAVVDTESQEQVQATNDESEILERAWTPSFSAYHQGSPTPSIRALHEATTITIVEEPPIQVTPSTDHAEKTDVDPEPILTTDLELDVDQPTNTAASSGPNADEAASDIPEQSKRSWTPSYSVTNQGSSLTNEDGELNDAEPLAVNDSELIEVQHSALGSESSAVQVRPSHTVAGAEDLAKNEKFVLFGLRAIVAYLWVLPKWLSMSSSNHNRREPSSSSSTSSKFFPGGWFTPKPNEGGTSFDVAQGEFATSSKMTASTDVFETLGAEATATGSAADTATDGDDGQKRKWCVVM